MNLIDVVLRRLVPFLNILNDRFVELGFAFELLFLFGWRWDMGRVCVTE